MRSRIPSLSLVVFLAAVISTASNESRVPRAITISVCEHGREEGGRCICETEYVGLYCERKSHCDGWQRYTNGTCISCQPGYMGNNCEDIKCGENGEPDKHGLNCTCTKPWSGQFCEILDTKHVYSYYNNKVYLLGPLGVLSLIPMCLILHVCEWMAQKRQVKRVEQMLDGQNITVNRRVVETLLV